MHHIFTCFGLAYVHDPSSLLRISSNFTKLRDSSTLGESLTKNTNLEALSSRIQANLSLGLYFPTLQILDADNLPNHPKVCIQKKNQDWSDYELLYK